MSKTALVFASLGSGLAFVALIVWFTWTFMLTRVDRVFLLLIFGYGDVGGQ